MRTEPEEVPSGPRLFRLYPLALALVRAGGDIDVIREGVQLVLQALIEAEAAAVIGAGRYERGKRRQTQSATISATVCFSPRLATWSYASSKLRQGSFFPSILERRRRVDRALYAVVMETCVHGVSSRKVDDLVAPSGGRASRRARSPASSLAWTRRWQGFVLSRLDNLEFPYLFADATYVKGRLEHQVVSRAVVVITGVNATGGREVLGVAVGDSETETFWTMAFPPFA